MRKESKAEKDFTRAVIALAEENINAALSLLARYFVGLTLEVIRRNGETPVGDIRIDGGPSRDITIHAPKDGTARGMTERVRWHEACKTLPDAETTVMLIIDGDDAAWPGYHDGERWRTADGMPTGHVIYWADMLVGPEAEEGGAA